jgi:hypothetical protein
MILTSGSFVNFKWWKAILNLRCQCQGGHSGGGRMIKQYEFALLIADMMTT